MAETPLARKLQIGPGSRVLVLNAPTGYRDRLRPLPEGAAIDEESGEGFDVVHLFVRDSAELDRHAGRALSSVREGGVLWISYPKHSSKVETDLTRDVGWETVKGAGLRPVAQVSVDDIWSALRFRPAEQVPSDPSTG
jgi:Protein of unknown function (DUF3052)